MNMKDNTTNAYSQNVLNKFAATQWEKVLTYLQSQFQLERTDCEDIFQESFIILYNQVVEGKISELSCSLSTYFISICRNKAHEHLRTAATKDALLEDSFICVEEADYRMDMIDKILAMEDNNDDERMTRKKASLVRQIVKDLPSPCNELLWAFYRDGISMKTMATMFNYKSESAVKVTKHRCCEKFKTRYEENVKHLF